MQGKITTPQLGDPFPRSSSSSSLPKNCTCTAKFEGASGSWQGYLHKKDRNSNTPQSPSANSHCLFALQLLVPQPIPLFHVRTQSSPRTQV
uniref:Uncharacterized protein LOC105641042 n=1 Tax=Rhizophora mucronata TaxID=61149 RepID=A0A2P2IL84_RHIMU